MIRSLALLLTLVTASSFGQDAGEVPPRLQSLKTNYEAAVARATAPLTATYMQELERLKAEFARAGDLKAALLADTWIKQASTPVAAESDVDVRNLPLSKMTVGQFKRWLNGITITEVGSPFLNQFFFDGGEITSIRAGTTTPRRHENVIIEVGKVFVPFTSTNATILFDEALKKAEITYSTGGKFEGTIEPKKAD
jgi:hypothetical protein